MPLKQPPPGTPKFLMNIKNGRVFPWTELLAKRGDLVPCQNADGSGSASNMIDANGTTVVAPDATRDPAGYLAFLEQQRNIILQKNPSLGSTKQAPASFAPPPPVPKAPASPAVPQPLPALTDAQIAKAVAQPDYQHPEELPPEAMFSSDPGYREMLESLSWPKLKRLMEGNGQEWTNSATAIEWLSVNPHTLDPIHKES